MDSNVSVGLSECLKPIENVGGTVYQNVCDGTSTFVPWGFMVWLGVIAITIVFIIVVVAVIKDTYF